MDTIGERYHRLHPGSFSRYEKALSLLPDGVTHDTRWMTPFPVYVTHAQGPYKWDVDGNKYVDYVMGHGALLLGHSHPEIVDVVTKQVALGTHVGASHDLEVEWARRVTDLIPSAEKVRFTSSGTEATLMALRLARAYMGREKVIKFKNHFHGWHDYVLAGGGGSLSGVPAAVLESMVVLEPSDIAGVEKTLALGDGVAAVILEPTGAHMGVEPMHPSFLEQLREVTSRYGVVLIFDEVVTGFRTSPGGAQARYDITPDLTTLAKILGGGLPGGAVAGKRELLDLIQHRGDAAWDAQDRVRHPGTFNANPVSAAAGVKALELVATTNVNARADAMANRLKDGFNRVLRQMEIPGCASGVASIVAVTLGIPHECSGEICSLRPDQIAESMPPQRGSALKRSMLNAGVDTMGGSRFLLSATHDRDEIDQTVNAFEEALTAMRGEMLI